MQITPAPRRHLDSSELLDCTSACPVCASETLRRPRVRVQSDPDVVMLQCPKCHACSASHMPRTEVLEDYYARYYDQFDRGVTFSDVPRFARHVAALLPSNALPGALRILDFGGGDGSLSAAVAERLIAAGRIEHASIDVIDFATREARNSERVAIRFSRPGNPLPEYDLILASAILEHIPDLHGLLCSLVNALAPGGLFYARTPYAIPLTRLFHRLDLTYPAHVHDLGSPFWNRFPETFAWPSRVLTSRPSLVAGTLRADPLRTGAAFALKLPAHIENILSPRERKGRLWHLAGGWEVLLQRK